MSGFKVGDVVEIIGSERTRPEALCHIGKRGVVLSVHIAGEHFYFPGEQWCRLAPTEISPRGWYARSLRKINPPDWSAPVVTDKELTA